MKVLRQTLSNNLSCKDVPTERKALRGCWNGKVMKHSYSHGCQMEMLARNGRGQTYPSGGQPPVKQHTQWIDIQLGRQSVPSQVAALAQADGTWHWEFLG